MADEAPFFARPASHLLELRVQPQLASWDSAGSPSKVRLEEFLRHAENLVQPQVSLLGGPLALRLDVGLPPRVSLLDLHDLDNYAFPLVTRLSSRGGKPFASVWCSKRHAGSSYIAVADPAVGDGNLTPPRWQHWVRTTTSASSLAFKQQIRDQLVDQVELPDGGVSLQLSYVLGPKRSWPNLWKPTIDALGSLLGLTDAHRPWHPRDGRIVELGLHCRVDPSLRNDVLIAIGATPRSPGE